MHYSTVQSMKSAADGHGAFAFFIHLHPQKFTTHGKKIAMGQEVSPWGLGAWAQLGLTDALS